MIRPGSIDDQGPRRPWVTALDRRDAAEPSTVGAKAAALTAATAAGLPVEPGIVLTTAGVARWHDDTVRDELYAAWRALTDEGDVAVIVRSSSTVEDAERSSMAGVFRSILDVRDAEHGARYVLGRMARVVERDAPHDLLTRSELRTLSGG